jgi:hypothetical protein
MGRTVIPDSALDWMTVRQICQSAAADLMRANPIRPENGRIDLYRVVTVDGRTLTVRMKLTILEPA